MTARYYCVRDMKNMKELDSLHLNAAGSMASHFNI